MSRTPIADAYCAISAENSWPYTPDDTKIKTFFQNNPEKLMTALAGPNPEKAQALARLLLHDNVITLDSLVLPDELGTLRSPPEIPSGLIDAIDVDEIERIFLSSPEPPGDTKPPTQRKRVRKDTAVKHVRLGLDILHQLLTVTGNVTQSLRDLKLAIMQSESLEQDKAIICDFIEHSRM